MQNNSTLIFLTRVLSRRLARTSLVCLATALVRLAIAAESCDLRVQIRQYDGQPAVQDEPVKILAADGTLIASVTATHGAAEVCDIGIREFSLVVGHDCGQVTIRGLRVLERPLVIPVYYQNCHGFRVYPECQVLLRVKSPTGIRLAGATITLPGRSRIQSDDLGRAELSIRHALGQEVTVSYGTSEPKKVPLSCTPETTVLEKDVIIDPGEAPKK